VLLDYAQEDAKTPNFSPYGIQRPLGMLKIPYKECVETPHFSAGSMSCKDQTTLTSFAV